MYLPNFYLGVSTEVPLFPNIVQIILCGNKFLIKGLLRINYSQVNYLILLLYLYHLLFWDLCIVKKLVKNILTKKMACDKKVNIVRNVGFYLSAQN